MAQLEMYRSVFEKSGGEPGCTASDQNLIPADASHPGPVEQKGAQPRPAPNTFNLRLQRCKIAVWRELGSR